MTVQHCAVRTTRLDLDITVFPRKEADAQAVAAALAALAETLTGLIENEGSYPSACVSDLCRQFDDLVSAGHLWAPTLPLPSTVKDEPLEPEVSR